MRSAETEFIGGPLDGRVLPVYLSPFSAVPKLYKVPVPAHGEEPARTLVYARAKRYSSKGRPRWVYEYQAPPAERPVAEPEPRQTDGE
ncbi:hypothetical protein OG455_28675 [Kitasatospora sp. NBC_01287]|uniref:hypothetical protein n=1 Tax=Kitasatospora sp. NBC_01287 TaxID=2903573 RepID=UPI002258D2C5|nr:hypothetical protein [Kitasatospora sp. NBC_01287]MCX4749438.1 hypothetical protein [Kitasatospora sp. NBC_01287]